MAEAPKEEAFQLDEFARDPDLEAVYLGADKIGATGVQQLCNALQSYRSLVRQAVDYCDQLADEAARTGSMLRLRECAAAMNTRLAELQWRLDLDHIDLNELTDE
jgi:hypothetical protein